MVLIDGDGMIFRNEFLCGGEAGGRRAASQLYAAIQAYTENETNDVPLGAKIVCRIYANVRGLADVLVRTGAVQSIGQFQDFVRGFTRGKTLFDFVDVGAGKDRADEKIIGECYFAPVRSTFLDHPHISSCVTLLTVPLQNRLSSTHKTIIVADCSLDAHMTMAMRGPWKNVLTRLSF